MQAEIAPPIEIEVKGDRVCFKDVLHLPMRATFSRDLVEGDGDYSMMSYDEDSKLIDMKLANGRAIYRVFRHEAALGGELLTGTRVYWEIFYGDGTV